MKEASLAQAVLRQILTDRGIQPGQLISASTAPQPTFIRGYHESTTKHLKKLSTQLDQSAVDAFIEKNQSQSLIEIVYGQLEDFVVATESEIKTIFEVEDRQGWNNFREQYPQSVGIVSLSHPGFSSDGSQCIIELGQQRDFLWGHGVAYLYLRTPMGWSNAGEIGTWIS